MPSLQAIHGRIVDLRRHTNVHHYGRRPLGPTDPYEIWIRPPDGVERKFAVNTRHMPARRGHEVSLIVTAHQVPKVLALANWSTIDGVNYARTDAPSLIRTWDFIVLSSAFLAMGVRFADVGMIVLVPAAAMYLVGPAKFKAPRRAASPQTPATTLQPPWPWRLRPAVMPAPRPTGRRPT